MCEAQPAGANYDEAQVPAYTLPELLKCEDGTPVTTADAWTTRRRGEILEQFRSQVFGRSPGRPAGMKWQVTSNDSDALDGKATRREVTIDLLGDDTGPQMHVMIYLPKQPARAPVILGYNFMGNHTIHKDPGITLSQAWMPAKAPGVVDNRATEASRGSRISRWPVEKIVADGFALATVYYGDVEPDHATGWRDGIRARLLPSGKLRAPQASDADTKSTTGAPADAAPDDWGAIGAWAWGLSRVLDYLETDANVDAGRVIVFGHSRLGKTALWAGAEDTRFAAVISNNSGEGGASLARRCYGERTANLNKSFPHWFCGNYKQYSDHEERLPVDAHMLIALSAPRPVYVASAVEDRWADPRGEFLAALAAEPVYRLFKLPGLGVTEWPSVDTPVGQQVRYHVRTGKHDVLEYDWEQYLAFGHSTLGR
ncbi:MAG: acetylxylan esterase [Planctomycetes bacterium]|nr:acetylxylan esterase [Planctomycetota bacterium]